MDAMIVDERRIGSLWSEKSCWKRALIGVKTIKVQRLLFRASLGVVWALVYEEIGRKNWFFLTWPVSCTERSSHLIYAFCTFYLQCTRLTMENASIPQLFWGLWYESGVFCWLSGRHHAQSVNRMPMKQWESVHWGAFLTPFPVQESHSPRHSLSNSSSG